jgi:hypothetical protein
MDAAQAERCEQINRHQHPHYQPQCEPSSHKAGLGYGAVHHQLGQLHRRLDEPPDHSFFVNGQLLSRLRWSYATPLTAVKSPWMNSERSRWSRSKSNTERHELFEPSNYPLCLPRVLRSTSSSRLWSTLSTSKRESLLLDVTGRPAFKHDRRYSLWQSST